MRRRASFEKTGNQCLAGFRLRLFTLLSVNVNQAWCIGDAVVVMLLSVLGKVTHALEICMFLGGRGGVVTVRTLVLITGVGLRDPHIIIIIIIIRDVCWVLPIYGGLITGGVVTASPLPEGGVFLAYLRDGPYGGGVRGTPVT
jgi:hypothetical protein